MMLLCFLTKVERYVFFQCSNYHSPWIYLYPVSKKLVRNIITRNLKKSKNSLCDLFKLCCDLKFLKCVIFSYSPYFHAAGRSDCIFSLKYQIFALSICISTFCNRVYLSGITTNCQVIDYKNADEIRACLNPLTNNWELQKDARPLEIGH